MPIPPLDFNSIEHSVSYKQQVLCLNPLSFKLLKVLAEADSATLSVATLLSAVWQNSHVSPETLKQRIFVLRKSIAEAGINGLVIQSVRGEGYRLIVGHDNNPPKDNLPTDKPTNAPTTMVKKKKTFIIVLLAVAITMLLFSAFNIKQPYANDRVALWTSVEPHKLSGPSATLYIKWRQTLLAAMQDSHINIVLSKKQNDMLTAVQTRKDRIAVVSYFEVLHQNNESIVNLSIIEARTATVLRTTEITLSSVTNIESILNSQLNGIRALVASGQLRLTKQQLDNPKDKIWTQLKVLANPE